MNWTPEIIKDNILTNDKWVERAIVAIYRRQTESERASAQTKHQNGVGFSAFHAMPGTYYARWVLGGKSLSGKHLEKARKIALRYVGQLSAIANQS